MSGVHVQDGRKISGSGQRSSTWWKAQENMWFSRKSGSVVCVAWKKYCLRPSKLFIDGKLPNVFQEGWIWVSCGFWFCFC